jgi:ornithine cyclodeaminase
MGGKRTEFVYLSEPDTIKAGVLNAGRCVDICEEVFALLARGDYLMGGPSHNSHGLGLVFPKETPFPNMPVAGPDRRFVAMPAYLGGRFDICGNKWYGSNAANPSKGLPRSVLTLVLNDKDTGEPISYMSANLISAARTGAIPAVAVRQLARKDAEVCGVIGCGPINKACFEAITTQMPHLKKVVCNDYFPEKAHQFASWAAEKFNIKAEAEESLEKTVRAGLVISIAASRLKPLFINDEWVQKGATVLFTGPGKSDESFWTGTKIVYDHIGLHEAYVEEAIASGDKEAYYAGVIGGPLYSLIDAGKLPALKKSTGIGDIITGKKPGRTSDDDRITFIACGMAVFDLGWGYELYQTALKEGIGQKLLLWEQSYQVQ